ncbi:hypothetical protein LguiA_000699 [Lonicera macranthoides]
MSLIKTLQSSIKTLTLAKIISPLLIAVANMEESISTKIHDKFLSLSQLSTSRKPIASTMRGEKLPRKEP